MLAPDSRTVAVELLRPPPDFTLDCVVMTTYSLDLEALLALPLAVLAQSDGGVEELLADPLTLLEAIRQAGQKVHVFVDEAGIAIPGQARALYAMLESSVHPVRAPNGGAFHPKVWIARFKDEDGAVLIRVAVLSRNLTFDRCWDVALASEASPKGGRHAVSGALGDLLRGLLGFAIESLPDDVGTLLEDLAAHTERTEFPSPEGFDGPVRFQALGLAAGKTKPWKPRADGSRLLAIAPFANRAALDLLAGLCTGERTLVSRQEALDDLASGALERWSSVQVLTAAEETEDGETRPSGLHAKIIGIEHGWDVTWYVGSANLTEAAFTGKNVEVMASVTGGKAGKKGLGIEKFQEAGFPALCARYVPGPPPDEVLRAARAALEAVRDALVEADFEVRCEAAGEDWSWTVAGAVEVPAGVDVALWPISVGEDQARTLALPSTWNLPITRLTCFVALRIASSVPGVDAIRITRKLPATGLPEGRVAHVLRSLIDSPERFLRFLRALLGGLEGLVEIPEGSGASGQEGRWAAGLGGETLLEDLVRAASRDPARLVPIRRLVEDLRSTEEGRKIVPDDLYAMWSVVDQAAKPVEAR